jgi:cytoskeletal protein CcmA (bactofilin family)
LSNSFSGDGNWEFSGQMRFAGQFKGKISGDELSTLQVLKGAKVEGLVEVPHLIVEGQLIECEVIAKHILFKKGCLVTGKITADKVLVEEGAKVEALFESVKKT